MLSPLFSGIDKHELGELFPDGTVTVKTLKKGDAVFTENDFALFGNNFKGRRRCRKKKPRKNRYYEHA